MKLEDRVKKLEDQVAGLSGNPVTDKKWIKIGDIEWLKDCSGKMMNWHEAKKWCAVQGGRLPTRLELLDLYDNHYEECRKLTGNDPEKWYWAVTESSATGAWYVNLSSGGTDYYNKATSSFYVCCVRDVK